MPTTLIQNTEVYKLAEKLSDLIWDAYDNWNYKAQHTIGLQAIRAADSISANLSEGFGRYAAADRKRFYIIARGSFEETKCWMRKAIRRKVLNPKEQSEIANAVNLLGPKLNLFIKNKNIQK